jgi:hypothetical protein
MTGTNRPRLMLMLSPARISVIRSGDGGPATVLHADAKGRPTSGDDPSLRLVASAFAPEDVLGPGLINLMIRLDADRALPAPETLAAFGDLWPLVHLPDRGVRALCSLENDGAPAVSFTYDLSKPSALASRDHERLKTFLERELPVRVPGAVVLLDYNVGPDLVPSAEELALARRAVAVAAAAPRSVRPRPGRTCGGGREDGGER